MRTRSLLLDLRVPTITSSSSRSTAMAAAGIFAISAICGIVAQRAMNDASSYSTSGGASIAVLGAIAVVVSVIRWVPSLSEHVIRPVPRHHAAILLAACAATCVAAVQLPGWRTAAIGALSSLCVLNVYVACWGYRSMFLLRRVALFSLLMWPTIADGVHDVVHTTLTGPSDFVFRRLAAVDVSAADAHPWRVLSAMNGHGAIAVTAVVILVLAGSRLRMSLTAIGRLLAGTSLAMVVHHALVLTAPIESYEPSWWAEVASGPIVELVIGTLVAVALYSMAVPSTTEERAATPSLDRDPAIFGAHGVATPARTLRLCSIVGPAFLMAAAVVAS